MVGSQQLHERNGGHAGGSRAFVGFVGFVVAVGAVCLFGLVGSARAARLPALAGELHAALVEIVDCG